MATTIIRPASREAWLKEREGGIGSSEIGTILGVNPYQTPYQLWRLKKGIDPPIQSNMPMRLGNLLEDAVSQLWSEETQREVIKASAIDWIAVNTEKPYFRASPDRTYWIPGMKKNNTNKGILECKTTQMTIDPDDLPKTWFCQLQWLLGVSETEQGSLAWLSMGRNFGHQDINLVPDFFGYMTEEAERFWIDNIIGNKEPEMTDASDVMIKYTRHTDGKVIEVGERILQAYSELKQVKGELKELEEKKESLEGAIKLAFQDAELIAYQGATLASWKAAKDSEKLDAKAMANAHPDIAAKFTTTTPGSRRFLLK